MQFMQQLLILILMILNIDGWIHKLKPKLPTLALEFLGKMIHISDV